MNDRLAELQHRRAVSEILTTPIGFIERVLGLRMYEWQDEIVSWFEDTSERVKASVVTPNGSGKSSVIVAGLALWWVAVHPRGRVVITSKDARQLDEQVWTSIEAHKARFPEWNFLSRYVETPTGGKIIGFTTNDAGRAEGWHKGDDLEGPLLIICDEAKSIEEAIFTAFDRCTFNALLYISSGGLMLGRFYDSHTKNAAQYRRRKVSLEECPHIPKEKIADIIEQYGREHPFTRSSVFGEFMEQDDATRFAFSLAIVQNAIQNPPQYRPGQKRAFCDFAAGGDENVLAIRDGNRVLPLIGWREKNTMAAVGRFITEFRKAGIDPGQIWADEGGLGKPMCDALAEAGWPVHRVNNQEAPLDPRYINRGGEMWHQTARRLLRGEIGLPDDPLLVQQLTTRQAKIDRDGSLGVMSKDDMRKLGLKSPDRADAVCGVCAVGEPIAQVQKDHIRSWREELEERARDHEDAYGIPGMDAGM